MKCSHSRTVTPITMKARARAIITPHMTVFAALDERPEEAQVFVSPLDDQSTEVDVEAEALCSAARPCARD